MKAVKLIVAGLVLLSAIPVYGIPPNPKLTEKRVDEILFEARLDQRRVGYYQR